MYIVNGIAYAGDPKRIIKVLSVRVLNNYNLLIKFVDGTAKVFDFQPLLDMPCYAPLKDLTVFNNVYVDYGCTVWNNGEIDIAPEKLYDDGISYNANAII